MRQRVSRPQLKRSALGGPTVKLRPVTSDEQAELIHEMRRMAAQPAGAAPGILQRAKEICFLVTGQHPGAEHIETKAREAYELLEILFSHRRWRDYQTGSDGLVTDIKSACDRLHAHAVGGR